MSRGRYISNENDELFDKVSKAYFREGSSTFGITMNRADTRLYHQSTNIQNKKSYKRRKKGQK